MQRINVVLPQPDGPSSPVMAPRPIRTEKSCSAGRFPRTTRKCSISTTGDAPADVNSSFDELII
jgi:hypothetical protein